MSETVEFSYRATPEMRMNIIGAEIERRGWRANLSSYLPLLVFVPALIISTAISVSLWNAGTTYTLDYSSAALGGATVLLAVLAAVLGSVPIGMKLEDRPEESPERRMTLSADGIHEYSPGLDVRADWSAVLSVWHEPGLTILLMSESQAFLIPDEALPESVSAQELRERIGTWRQQ